MRFLFLAFGITTAGVQTILHAFESGEIFGLFIISTTLGVADFGTAHFDCWLARTVIYRDEPVGGRHFRINLRDAFAPHQSKRQNTD